MIIRWLAIVFTLMLGIDFICGQGYKSARPERGWVDPETLTMLAIERETIANQLAAYVANTLTRSSQSNRNQWAARILGIALTLHPQNPRAQQTNDALASNVQLPALESENAPEVLSRLLYHRAKQLEKSTDNDKKIARYLIAIAVYMTPYFEDGVYDFEKQRLRDGALNWKPISGETEDSFES